MTMVLVDGSSGRMEKDWYLLMRELSRVRTFRVRVYCNERTFILTLVSAHSGEFEEICQRHSRRQSQL